MLAQTTVASLPRPPFSSRATLAPQGHSRTVVGVERRRLRWDSQEETFLLILDPSTRTGELTDKLRAGTGWQGLVRGRCASARARGSGPGAVTVDTDARRVIRGVCAVHGRCCCVRFLQRSRR